MEMSPFLFGLYKFVKYAAYPLSWILALLVITTIMLLLPYSPRRQRWIRRLSFSSLFLLVALSTPIIGGTLIGLLEMTYPPVPTPVGSRFDAIVVLGGGTHNKGTLRPTDELSELSVRRTTCGAHLFLQGLAPKLLVTGGDGLIFGHGLREAVEMKRWALELGVPEPAILVEDQARTTYENAVQSKRLLGHSTVLLVTSAYHLPRAMGLFQKQGLTPIPVGCGYLARNRPLSQWDTLNVFALLPDAVTFDVSTKAIAEFIGIMVYWSTGKS